MNEKSIPLVSMRNISKTFDGIIALDNVSIDIYKNEVIGLVGDNGAGKSTLIKILCGAYQASRGEIFFEGKRVDIKNPKIANDLGIDVVYQDLALVDEFSVSQNIFLGKEIFTPIFGRFFEVLNNKKMLIESKKLLDKLKISIANPKSRADELSGGQRQSVAISRAINTKKGCPKKLLILDEPTAALGVDQKKKVSDLIKKLKDEGLTLIVITHNIEDVFELCTRVIVLFTGRVAGIRDKDKTNKEEVVSLIVGAKKD